jgi:hypothetical protein
MAILTILCMGSCEDWGQMDPPTGNQIYPKLEQVASLTFDEELDPTVIQPFAYSGGDTPVLWEDDDRGSVLYSNDGYARIANPLNSVKVQNAVSLTFWVKQAIRTDEETGEELNQDLEGALFSFQNGNGTQRMFFTANGWLSYEGIDGTFEDNNPASAKTGLMAAGEWHYVAIAVTNEGYFVYVDGLKKIERTITNFDCSKIVQFMASVSYLYIGYGSDSQTQNLWLDDLTIYRNTITSKEWSMKSSGGEDEEESKYIIVGNEDCTTGWWSAFSDLVKATGNQTIHFGFYNYTNGSANWNNWLLVLTNGKDRDETGYAEYCVLRSDAYGWGDASYTGDNISHNFNWDTFTTDMKGAYVDLTIKRTDSRVDVTAIVTTTTQIIYTYTFYHEGITTADIGAFLTCEGSYLEIDPEKVYVGQSYASGTYRVGPANCTAGWWSSFSDFFVISGNTAYPFVYTFYNYTNGAANWNNWLLVVTNGKDRDETGYAEYFVLRADAYGWGDAYNGDNMSHNFNWDTFIAQMDGAYCMIILTRNGNRLDMTARVTAANGTKLDDYTYYIENVTTTDVGLFLTVEGASLDMRTVAWYPYLNMTK